MASEFETQVTTSLASLHEKNDALRVELLGNGQPGRIQRIESEIKEQDKEIAGLNKKVYLFSGGLVVASHFLKAAMSKVFGGHWN